MSKETGSREFFEVFKTPENVPNTQNKEVKPVTELSDVIPQKPPIPATDTKAEVDNKAVNKATFSADPLGWIKNTRKEDVIFRKKLDTPIQDHSSGALKDERTPRKDEITLRQETLIIGAIAATFLSIACFFVGHKIGYNKAIMSRVEEWAEALESQPQDIKKTGLGQPRSAEISQKAINKPLSQKTEKQIDQAKTQDTRGAGTEVARKTSSKVSSQKAEKSGEQPKPIIKDKWTLRVISYKNTKENVERAKEVAKEIQNSLGYDAFVVNAGKEVIICVGEFEANDSADLTNVQKALAELSYRNKKQFEGCYPIRMR